MDEYQQNKNQKSAQVENKQNKPLPLILILFIFLSGLVLKIVLVYSLPLYHDVGWYISLLKHHDSSFMNLIVLEHPPWGYYPYLFSLELFGVHDYAIRLVPLFFGLLELALIYLIAKKWFGKRTADFSIILFSLLYFVVINTLSPEGDGSIASVFSLLLFYFFSAYYDAYAECGSCAKKKLFLILSGVFLGALLLIKVRMILFFIPLFIYSLYRTRVFLQTVKDLFIVGLLSLLIFAIFPLQIYLVSSDISVFITLLKQVILHNTGTFSLFYKLTHPLLFLQVFVVLSFLTFFLFFKGISLKQDKLILLLLWSCSLFIILLTILPEGLAAAYPRYIAFLLPPILLLCSRGFAVLPFEDKELFIIFSAAGLLALLFLAFNQYASSYWFFETAAMGILKVSKSILLLVFIASPLLLILFYNPFTSMSHRTKQGLISLFIIINIGFNLLLIGDPIIDRTHKHIIADFKKYYQEHQIKNPVFLWAEDLAFYLGISGKNINLIKNPALYTYAKSIGYNDEGYYYIQMNDNDSLKVLEERGGTVFSLYYPLEYTLEHDRGRNVEYNYLASRCALLQSFDYPLAKGVVFEC